MKNRRVRTQERRCNTKKKGLKDLLYYIVDYIINLIII